jgi:hypothetical protein
LCAQAQLNIPLMVFSSKQYLCLAEPTLQHTSFEDSSGY